MNSTKKVVSTIFVLLKCFLVSILQFWKKKCGQESKWYQSGLPNKKIAMVSVDFDPGAFVVAQGLDINRPWERRFFCASQMFRLEVSSNFFSDLSHLMGVAPASPRGAATVRTTSGKKQQTSRKGTRKIATWSFFFIDLRLQDSLKETLQKMIQTKNRGKLLQFWRSKNHSKIFFPGCLGSNKSCWLRIFKMPWCLGNQWTWTSKCFCLPLQSTRKHGICEWKWTALCGQ